MAFKHGNQLRTGKPKPAGSGWPAVPGPHAQLTIRMTMEYKVRLYQTAKKMGVSVGSVVREAVAEFIEQEEEYL